MAKANQEASTDLTTTSSTALAAGGDWGALEEYAGQGLDDLDSSDRSIPFLKILEKQSPEVETVEGARPGMWINTATQKLYSTLRFVPACRDHMFVEWKPIDQGGGLIASYGLDQAISKWAMKQRGKISLRNGNDLVETFYLFGIVMPADGDDDEPYPAVISFTSTRIKGYKTIVNRSDSIMLIGAGGRKFKAPWFCHVWKIGTEKKVDGNQTWYVPTAGFDSPNGDAAGARLPADHPVVQMGAEMVRQKQTGELVVNAADQGGSGEQPSEDEYSGASNYGTSKGNSAQRQEEDPPF